MRWFGLLVVFVPVWFAFAQSPEKPAWTPSPHVAATEPLRPEAQVKKFRLPPGFEIQLVASDPDIRKPINIAFDAAGRLWVTETIEYPFAAPEGKGRDAVKILEDFGPDGRARKITTFADGLNIPIGVLPIPQGALVYSIPAIHRMLDTTGDGKADIRDVLYSKYGFADTHGMTGEFTQGFDGWVYACHGFSNTSKVTGSKANSAITMQSGNTYRFKPDGSRIEYHTHGQVNPFGLAFDTLGNLFSTDCHTRPLYQLLRGGHYPSFGKPHDGLGFAPEMVTHDHGSTAISGIAYYAADQYPKEFRDNLFVGNVVTNRINRDRLQRHGSTYKGIELPDFVKCDDPWFRPVDIKLGPDGCLYVADFYNRIIGHYEVPLNHPGRDRDKGRIWRIVYRGVDGKEAPRAYRDLTRSTPAQLVKELDDPNLTVRLAATHQLVAHRDKGAEAVREATTSGSAYQRAHGLWVLQRLGKLDKKTLGAACKDKEALVRVHAQRILSDCAKLTTELRNVALAGLNDADAFVQRAAVEALGAHPQSENVLPLVALRMSIPAEDTHLLHATRMALRDQLRSESQWDLLAILPRTEGQNAAIADVCPGVHTPEAAHFLFTGMRDGKRRKDFEQTYVHTVARYGSKADVTTMVGLMTSVLAKDLGAQAILLKTVQQASQERGTSLGDVERKIASELVRELLSSPNPGLAQRGVELANSFRTAEAQPALLALVQNAKAPENLRKDAVSTLVAIEPVKNLDALRAMLLNESEAIPVREQIANALAGTNRAEAHAGLVKALESAPARLQTVIALGMAGSPQGGERLLDAVATGKASPRILQDRAIEIRLKQAKVNQVDQRLARLTKGLPAADQKAQQLIASRRTAFVAANPDVLAGQKTFAKHCANCHQLANLGAKIGPQLDGIGNRGVERILEDVLDPHRNVDQAFRATTLALESGQLVTGLVLREEGQVIVIADAQGKEQRVAKGAVAERQVSPLSPMPSNFADQVSEREFLDLVAYLLAQRVKE